MQSWFLVKLLVLSTAISVWIKYGAPSLNVTPSVTSALILVFSPTIIMAVLLANRWRRSL
jgi:hypothetical protein